MKKIKCIICNKEFVDGWYNSRSGEGICEECLDENSKIKLLDFVVGQ
jgi:hypothetical protein